MALKQRIQYIYEKIYQVKINPTRLQQHFEAMSLIGKIGDTGTCRPTMTALEKQGFELAATWMKEAGMKTHIDNFGNLSAGSKEKIHLSRY